jgi:signal transduction histidine kinase/CheY-like chemotaxis protein
MQTDKNLFKRWQSLRVYNITILCAFFLFYLIGTLQSYTFFSAPAAFKLALIFPLSAVIGCAYITSCLINKKDQQSIRFIPIIAVFTTLFITINSHFETDTSENSFLYFTLLLPLFYAYILAYDFKLLAANNLLVIISYSFTAVIGETSTLVFIFNLLFLSTLIALTLYSHIKNNNPREKKPIPPEKQNATLEEQNALYLHSIIHDIRQPLSSLSLYTHLLDKSPKDPQQKTVITNLLTTSTQLEHWISSLFELATLETKNLQANLKNIPIETCLSSIIKKQATHAQAQGMVLKTRLLKSTLRTDPKLLSEIIDNLLSNALLHGSQRKGEVVLLSAHQQDGLIKIQVWNRGSPIQPEQMDSLFDEHYYANNPLHNKSKGVGLGLALSQRKALLLNTKIEAKTSKNGSCFSIKVGKGIDIEEHPPALAFNQPTGKHILLIDDDESILAALSILLRNWGYNVSCAGNSEQAIALLESTAFALIISDYQLPGNKNGIELIKVAQQKQAIPSLLLTGDIDPDKLKEGELRSYKILHKPIKAPVLRLLLRQLLVQ